MLELLHDEVESCPNCLSSAPMRSYRSLDSGEQPDLAAACDPGLHGQQLAQKLKLGLLVAGIPWTMLPARPARMALVGAHSREVGAVPVVNINRIIRELKGLRAWSWKGQGPILCKHCKHPGCWLICLWLSWWMLEC